MWLYYNIQFFVFNACVYVFTLYTFVIYYSDVISSVFRDEMLPEYDYIIVGSGTAGSLIAHRLSTETNFTFIVLEAGSRSNLFYEIPAAGPALHRSIHDWMYETVPQEFACGAMVDRKCRLPQGKIIGGSAKLNNMVHVRGNISHYVEWFHGKYTMEYIKQQFQYIERNILHLNELQYVSDLAETVLNGAKEVGSEIIENELNFKKGFSKSILSQNRGKRWATSDNLDSKHIITNSLVEKVVMDDNKAVGVKIDSLGRKNFVKAKKGVILSAGTYNSPKLLQLSGIGPKKLLKYLGINVVKDLPVGQNLQDHVASGFDLVLFDNFNIKAADTIHPFSMFEYFFKGKGPLTMPGCEAIGFVSTMNRSEPDLQFMALPFGLALDRGAHLRKAVGIKDEVWNQYFAKLFDKYTATIMPIVLHPKSKGTVSIQSTDASIAPRIDPRYLSHIDDSQILIKGLKFLQNLLQTRAFKSAGANINRIHFPGCENHELFSDSYWHCYIKQMSFGSYHPVGTCAMGDVVDSNYKVRGVESLYVADASVLPTLPSGNINAAIAMMASVFFEANIATMASEFIKSRLNFVCLKTDLVYEMLFNVCVIYTHTAK